MPRGGQNLKPTAQAVREGNPGKRSIRDSAVLPPSALREPDWDALLGGDDPEMQHARGVAAELWRRTTPTLVRSAGLVGEQRETLADYCVTWARIVQGERSLSRDGVIVTTERGQVKNGWTTVLNQYRAHFRSLVGELGLSPQSVSRINRPAQADDDDPFDDEVTTTRSA